MNHIFGYDNIETEEYYEENTGKSDFPVEMLKEI